ncbi:MAG TPA: DUF4956 domain-containing protein [Myxococcales bacterium]|nr:DUF4956 domain-containing protein [Myxococcales bacterium]
MMTNSSLERLASRLGVGSGSRQIGRTTLVRLSLYYAAVLVIVAGLIILTGNMKGTRLADARGAEAAASGALAQDTAAAPTELTASLWDPLFRSLPPLGTGAAAVLAAFLLALPVAFTYVRTRNSLKYDQSVVQTVIMLPVVITAILLVVENSLALAFSLAGIVAAVRFRNNLKDSRDAVYIFAAVGIGFASGVGVPAIAALLSIIFCVLELLLWKLDLAADHEHTFGLLCLPAPRNREPLALEAAVIEASPISGEASLAAPSADTGLLALGGGKPMPDDGAAKRPAERLLVYCSDPEKARALADAILEEMAKRYKLKKMRNGGNDRYVLEYRVRTRKKSPAAAIIERLHAEGVPHVIAAEVVADEDEGPGKADPEKA